MEVDVWLRRRSGERGSGDEVEVGLRVRSGNNDDIKPLLRLPFHARSSVFELERVLPPTVFGFKFGDGGDFDVERDFGAGVGGEGRENLAVAAPDGDGVAGGEGDERSEGVDLVDCHPGVSACQKRSGGEAHCRCRSLCELRPRRVR